MKNYTKSLLSKNNQQYELNVIEIEQQESQYIQIPLDSDIVLYGMISYGDELAFRNTECSFGCFYAPFIEYKNVNEMLDRVEDLVQAFHYKRHFFLPQDRESISIKILAHKYIDKKSNARFVAISGINSLKKDSNIKKLNIKTMRLKIPAVHSINSWNTLISDLENKPNQIYAIDIEKHDIMDFESMQARIVEEDGPIDLYKVQEVIILQPNECEFFATHFATHLNDIGKASHFFDHKTGIGGWTYNLKKYRVTSIEEIDHIVLKMIQSFRTLTGITGTKVIVLQNQISDFVWDIGAIVCGQISNSTDNEEEEVSF